MSSLPEFVRKGANITYFWRPDRGASEGIKRIPILKGLMIKPLKVTSKCFSLISVNKYFYKSRIIE